MESSSSQGFGFQEHWPERQLLRHPVKKVLVCGKKLHPPLFSHVVNFPRLEIPLHGCYENQIESNESITTVPLRPGDALFAAPNCWNLPTWRLNVELVSLLFGKKHLGISVVTGRGPDMPQLAAQKFSIPWPLTGPLPNILEAMVEVHAAGGPQEALVGLSQALIYCVQELLQHPASRAAGRAQGLLESVCAYLQNHYQYDITRESVAQQFNITPNHLSRLFQTHGSMMFSNYLTHVRMDRAKHLLRSYDLKLDDIAVRCGYRDTPYFCRVFKGMTKATPAEYRATARRSEAAK
jgi:AraC-like DNA-binding protein